MGFVAVATAGTNRITWSTDGVTWNLPSSGVSAAFVDITHDGTQFIAVASNGTIYTSPSGDVWSTGVVSLADASAIHHHGGLTVVVNTTNGSRYSTDLVTWSSTATLPFGGSGGGRRLTYSEDLGLWIATSFYRSTTSQTIAKSTDATSWTNAARTGETIDAVHAAAGAVIAVRGAGFQNRSTDGVTWTQTSDGDTQQRGLTHGAGLWVAAGDAGTRLASSSDGVSWTARSTAPVALRDVAWDPNTLCFAAVGTNGVTRSTDGITWTPGTISAGAWVALCAELVYPVRRGYRGIGLVRGSRG